jgi:hypothetical protein
MIKIGNTPVIMTGHSGVIDSYLERNHSPELIRAFTEATAVKTPRGKNLLFPNYPDLPPARINQIVVPTGATRWSYGLFIVTTIQKDLILEESAGNENKLTVEFGAPENWKEAGYGEEASFKPNLTLTMSPLPPRPMTPDELSAVETDDIQNLWLLCMVDQRYWWQFKNVDLIEDQEFDDIQSILVYLNEQLGSSVDMSCASSAHTEIPDLAAGNNYENAAVVLESLAWHIGCQLVPELNSTSEDGEEVETGFVLISVDDSVFIYENNLDGKCGIASCSRDPYTDEVTSDDSGFELTGAPLTAMGGSLEDNLGSAFLPAKILLPARGTYVSRTPAEAGLPDTKTIPLTSAVLRLHWKDVDSPSIELRDKAAKDFYGRFAKTYDYTFNGVQKWQPTAYDDSVTFFQTRFQSGYRCQTRVRSWHHNLIPETIPTSVSAGGSHHIMFSIVDVFCPDDIDNEEGVFFVLAEWTEYTGGCDTDPPGVDPYTGYLKIYDTCVLEAYYTAYDLAGKEGYATYLYPRTDAGSEDAYAPCKAKWKALSLCGEPGCG